MRPAVKRRLVTLAAAALTALCGHAHAALFDFTLKGKVTYSQYSDIAVGDPFVVRYIADSTDLNLDPKLGRFATTAATFEFPNVTVAPEGQPLPLQVQLSGPEDSDSIIYVHFFPGNIYWSFSFGFPAQTFSSDALPLTLPLERATLARIQFFVFAPTLRGDITSYESAEIPEPVSLNLIALLVCALTARTRQYGGDGAGRAVRCLPP